MAFRSFTDERLDVAAFESTNSEATSLFTRLEWAVVALARHDPLSSVDDRPRFDRFMRLAFGRRARNRLADPRLEALRRIAVRFWSNAAPAARDQAVFLSAGFTAGHVTALLSAIRSARAAAQPKA